MTLLNHIGVLLLLLLLFNLIKYLNNDFSNYKWHIPFKTGLIIWTIFEAFYWIIKICF